MKTSEIEAAFAAMFEAAKQVEAMNEMRPGVHRHMPLVESFKILAGLFADVQASHSVLSGRGKVSGDRLPDRIVLLCERAEACEVDRIAMDLVRAALRSGEPVSDPAVLGYGRTGD